jgi:triacylglycerol lipase
MGDISDIEPDDIKNLPTFRATYSDRTALLMAKLSKRVYDPFNDEATFEAFQKVFTPLGLKVRARLIDEEKGTAGAVLESPDIIVIVFRGTENLLDWLTNFRMGWGVLQGEVKVHKGVFFALTNRSGPCCLKNCAA